MDRRLRNAHEASEFRLRPITAYFRYAPAQVPPFYSDRYFFA